jgi:hypothetical protein
MKTLPDEGLHSYILSYVLTNRGDRDPFSQLIKWVESAVNDQSALVEKIERGDCCPPIEPHFTELKEQLAHHKLILEALLRFVEHGENTLPQFVTACENADTKQLTPAQLRVHEDLLEELRLFTTGYRLGSLYKE